MTIGLCLTKLKSILLRMLAPNNLNANLGGGGVFSALMRFFDNVGGRIDFQFIKITNVCNSSTMRANVFVLLRSSSVLLAHYEPFKTKGGGCVLQKFSHVPIICIFSR